MQRQRPAFNANPDTGRLAYRNPEFDPMPDDRPTLVFRDQFWKDEDERLRYERAVKLCPLREYGHMKFDEYLAEVVKVAIGLRPSGELVKSMGER